MTAFAIAIMDILFVLLFARAFLGRDESSYLFNPYLLWADKATSPIIRFVKDLIPRASSGVASMAALLFLIAFRGAVLSSSGAIVVTVGSVFNFTPRPGWDGAIIASAMEFVVFLTRLWGLHALTLAIATFEGRRSRMAQAFAHLARPASALPGWARWPALFAVNVLLAVALPFAMAPSVQGAQASTPLSSIFNLGTTANAAMAYIGMGLLSLADMLLFARDALILAIFASLFAAIFGNRTLASFLLEFENALLGRFARRNLAAGVFDFSPILFFLAASLAYGMIVAVVTMAMKHLGVIAAGALALQPYQG